MRHMLSALLVSTALLTGCAGTAPKATFIAPPVKDTRVRNGDTVKVAVVAGAGVEMLESERLHLGEVISQKLGQFQAMNPATGTPVAYDLEVTVSRFEKGNAFARAMLAGLGQIHIDARVRLLSAADQSQVSAFDLKKTFAWGGMYGATTGIEDVEPAFAEGVASALTGLEEAKK
ncbi:MAG: DUF4410 domain-containing protein [Gammaproteobacteria bacterium]|nr:DUF4410 domain-containing protein [Gammaproteobacteria bacterium]